ncbi:MAG: hypothetical protein AVDCRST_MAG67-2358, partial [uncultured Solirubrobacteraceae bacterium]
GARPAPTLGRRPHEHSHDRNHRSGHRGYRPGRPAHL